MFGLHVKFDGSMLINLCSLDVLLCLHLQTLPCSVAEQAGELLRPCLAELARGRGEQSPLRARFVPAQTPALPTAAGGCQAQLCLPLSVRGCQGCLRNGPVLPQGGIVLLLDWETSGACCVSRIRRAAVGMWHLQLLRCRRAGFALPVA